MKLKQKDSAIDGLIVLYAVSRIVLIILSYSTAVNALKRGLGSVSLFTKIYAVCSILVILMAIICLANLYSGSKRIFTVSQLSFAAALLAFGTMALGAYQDREGFLIAAALLLIIAEALWFVFCKKSKKLAAYISDVAQATDSRPENSLSHPPRDELSRAKSLLSCKAIAELGYLISREDNDVFAKISEIIENPGLYIENNCRLDNATADIMSPAEIIWLAMTDMLIEAGYAQEIDYKEETDSIIWKLDQLAENLCLPVAGKDFHPSDAAKEDTEILLREAGEFLLCYGIVLGSIDIDSDSYVLFICSQKSPSALLERGEAAWRESAGKRINFTFGGENFYEKAEATPSINTVALRKDLRLWLSDISAESIPQKIVAVNLGLVEGPYNVYASLSEIYREDDPDWATRDDFVLENRYCPGLCIDSRLPWQQVHCAMAAVIRELMMELPEDKLLGLPYVTVGFDSGDLFRVQPPVAKGNPSSPKSDVPHELDYVIYDFFELTKLPTIELKPVREKTSVYSSKLGGVPYLPPDFQYPRAENDDGSPGDPLRLLAQINFSDFIPLEGFPSEGILQFYSAQDDLYGAHFDDMVSQKRSRVIYHRDIITETSALQAPPPIPEETEDCFPFQGEYLLKGKLSFQAMSPSDCRFPERFMELYKSYLGDSVKSFNDIPDAHSERVWDALTRSGTRLGGYPFFTQNDPRDDRPQYEGHDILLFQCDSDAKLDILWGDCGVANFFIGAERLDDLDFSEVLYNWDCY